MAQLADTARHAWGAFLSTLDPRVIASGTDQMLQYALSRPPGDVLRGEAERWAAMHVPRPLLYRVTRQLPPCRLALSAHESGIRSVGVTPDAAVAVTLGEDGTLRGWRLDSGRQLWVRRLDSAVGLVVREGEAVAWGPDGRLGSWSTCTGEERLSFTVPGPVHLVVLSADGRFLATISASGALHVWSLEGGAHLAHRSLEGTAVRSALWTDAGIFVGHEGGAVRRLEADTIAELAMWQWPSPGTDFKLLALAPGVDGDTIRVDAEHQEWGAGHLTDDPGPMRVRLERSLHVERGWGSSTRQERTPIVEHGDLRLYAAGSAVVRRDEHRVLARFVGHSAPITHALLLPGQRLLTAADDGSLRVWDLTAEASLEPRHDDPINQLELLRDGRHVVTFTSYRWGLWNSDGPATPWEIGSPVALAPETGTLAAIRRSTSYEVEVDTFRIGTRQLDRSSIRQRLGTLRDAALSDDGWVAALTTRPTIGVRSAAGEVALLHGHAAMVQRVIAHPDGRRLLSLAQDGTVRVWSIPEARQAACHRVKSAGMFLDMSLLDDGEHVMLSSSGGLMVLSLRNGEVVDFAADRRTMCLPRTDMLSLSYSPDGTLRASTEYPDKLLVVDNATDRPLEPATVVNWAAHTRPVFLNDNTLLLSDGPTVHRWDVRTRTRCASYAGHEGRILRLCRHPDGQRFVSAAEDSTIRVWDIASGRCLQTLPGYASSINALQVLDDGLLFASGWDPGESRFFDIDGPDAPRPVRTEPFFVYAISSDGQRMFWTDTPSVIAEFAVTGDEVRYTADVKDVFRLSAYFRDRRQVVCQTSRYEPFALDLASGERRPLERHDLPAARSRRHCSDPLVSLDAGASALRITTRRTWTTRTLKLPEGAPRLLRVERTGRVAALCLSDSTVSLFDLERGDVIGVCVGHDGSIVDIDLSADGTRLATVARDGTARLWSLPDCSEVACYLLEFPPCGCLLTMDGDVAVADVTGGVSFLRLWQGGRES